MLSVIAVIHTMTLGLVGKFSDGGFQEVGRLGHIPAGVLEGIAYRLEASTRELKRYREGELRAPAAALGHDQ